MQRKLVRQSKQEMHEINQALGLGILDHCVEGAAYVALTFPIIEDAASPILTFWCLMMNWQLLNKAWSFTAGSAQKWMTTMTCTTGEVDA